MHEETAEKTKARRDLRILMVCLFVGVGLPVFLFLIFHVRSAP